LNKPLARPKADAPEIHPLDVAEVRAFLIASENHRLAAFWRLALDCGAHSGELRALLWPEVDFQAGSTYVRQSLEDLSGRCRVKPPKTARSRRTQTIVPSRSHGGPCHDRLSSSL
jgi:integrase